MAIPQSHGAVPTVAETLPATPGALGFFSPVASRLWLLGQFGARRDARGRGHMHVAEFDPVGCQYRADGVSLVVDQQDRAVTRYDREDLLTAARRGERAGESAAVLLLDDQGKWNTAQFRLAWSGCRMMIVAAAESERLAFALPGAAQVGNGSLRGGRNDI